ncbi:MAG: SpoIIE family protein phosphatase [Actinomycetes bacterium]
MDLATSPLPRIVHEALAAVLLVDLSTSQVVHANRQATLMAGEQPLPMGVDEWSRRAGLLDPTGRDLSDSAGPLSRVARGEPVAGELVRRDPGAAGRGESPAGPAAAEESETGPLWVTGFPLEQQATGRLVGTALVVFMRITSDGDHAMRARAVLATGLSFTISDPSQPDNPLVWVNPAFTATTGYELRDVIGRNCRFLQGPGTDPASVARLREAVERAEPIVETVLNYRADGTAFWNEVSISPVFDGDGQLVNFVGVQADVTSRMEAQAERLAALQAERRARGRLSLLADVAEAATELDSPTALQGVADVVAPALVPWCAFVVANGHLRVVATAGDIAGPARDTFPLPRGWDQGADGDVDDPVGAQVVGRRTESVDLGPASGHPEGSLTRWLTGQLNLAGEDTCMSVPVPGRRDVLGLLVVGCPDDGLGEEDLALVGEVARRVGLSLENARLYAREHQLAETLQRSMLPEQAGVPGLDLWSYYAPNVDHAQVGGDWYDVLQLGADAVGLVVGDVVGHDVEAAAAMGQLRSVVRAYAFEQEEPGQVLMRVDQLVAGMRIPRSASLVLATLTSQDDGWDLEWSRAGHLPPLLVSGGEVYVLSEAGGTLVGVGDRPRQTASRTLVPGDVLLLYTDGLIERRSRPLMDGLQMLREVAASLVVSDAAGIGEQLLTALGDEPEDDMAIVVLRVPEAEEPVEEPSGAPRQRRWQLPGDPSSIGRARRLTVRSCRAWGMDCGPEAELVVSELVANAVLHGWGPVGLRLRHSARGLVIEVDDANPSPPSAVESERQGVGGYGMHVVQRLAEWGWHRSGAGKTVWARVPERGQPPSA